MNGYGVVTGPLRNWRERGWLQKKFVTPGDHVWSGNQKNNVDILSDKSIEGGSPCPECYCVSELRVLGHGDMTHKAISGMSGENTAPLVNADFCEDCTIWLQGCHTSGAVSGWASSAQRLAVSTGCVVMGTGHDSRFTTTDDYFEYKHLPSGALDPNYDYHNEIDE